MWIITSEAFLSVVHKAPCADDELLVRARTRAHLAAIFPDARIVESDGTDYRFRAIVKKDAVAMAMVEQVYSINYRNLKDTVKDRPFHDALMDVWRALARMQPFGVYGHRKTASQRGMFADDRRGI